MNDSTDKHTSTNTTREYEGAPQVSPNVDQIKKRRETLELFSAAWSNGDVDALLDLMSENPVYKGSTGEGPGTTFTGREEVRANLARMVSANKPSDTNEDPVSPPQMYFFADRALVYWHLTLAAADGSSNEVDGVDVITFTDDGRIAVKDAYRKAFT